MEEHAHRQWRARLKRRRGKTFNPIAIRELNLVAMMDMMTLILVFLLKSWSVSAMSIPVAEDIKPPKSTNLIRPPEAVKLTVTKASASIKGVIAVDSERVIELDGAKLKELEGQTQQRNFLIKDLQAALIKKADGIKYIATKNPEIKFDGKILIIADKDLPYWLITQVLFTAAEAGFEQYKLVAMREKEY